MTRVRVGFAIFGCLTIPKYKQQIIDAYKTWVQTAIQRGCIVRFFVGDIPEDSDLDPVLQDMCSNVEYGDSYLSATYKQWIGLSHFDELEEPCDFYFTAGTDTFICVDRFLTFLDSYLNRPPFLLGSSVSEATIENKKYTYYSGGAGLCLNRDALRIIMPTVAEFLSWYFNVASTPVLETGNVIKNYVFACDLQLAILCQSKGVHMFEISDSLLLGSGNHKSELLDKKRFLTCHHMSHEDFYDAQMLLNVESS